MPLAAKKATNTIPIVMASFQTPWLQVWLLVWRGREAISPGTQSLNPELNTKK